MFFPLPNPRFPFQDAEQEEKKEERVRKIRQKLKENETVPTSKEAPMVRSMQTLTNVVVSRMTPSSVVMSQMTPSSVVMSQMTVPW